MYLLLSFRVTTLKFIYYYDNLSMLRIHNLLLSITILRVFLPWYLSICTYTEPLCSLMCVLCDWFAKPPLQHFLVLVILSVRLQVILDYKSNLFIISLPDTLIYLRYIKTNRNYILTGSSPDVHCITPLEGRSPGIDLSYTNFATLCIYCLTLELLLYWLSTQRLPALYVRPYGQVYTRLLLVWGTEVLPIFYC